MIRIGFVLKVHRVMGLVIQKSLPFKEGLPPLEGTLLLHLLEGILIALQNITCATTWVEAFGAALVIIVLIKVF